MTNHPNFDRAQAILDASGRGDYALAFDNFADDIVMENGPGAGPRRSPSYARIGTSARIEVSRGLGVEAQIFGGLGTPQRPRLRTLQEPQIESREH